MKNGRVVFRICLSCGCVRFVAPMEEIPPLTDRYHCYKCSEMWTAHKPRGKLTYTFADLLLKKERIIETGEKKMVRFPQESKTAKTLSTFVELSFTEDGYVEVDSKDVDEVFSSLCRSSEDKGMCSICTENRADVLYEKCNHLCICTKCKKKHSEAFCPICRTIGGVRLVYLN